MTHNNLKKDLVLVHESQTTGISYNGFVNLQPTKIHVDIYETKSHILGINEQIKTDDFVIDLCTASNLTAEHGADISKEQLTYSVRLLHK